MLMRKALLISFTLLLGLFGHAQKNDTSRVELLLLQNRLSWNDAHRDSSKWIAPDTTLNSFHYHYPSFWNLNSFLGYLGTPVHYPIHSNRNSPALSMAYDRLGSYRLNSRTTDLYQLSNPYTNAFYVWSTRREEMFKLSHSQNLTDNLNIAANYQRISNQGWFDRQVLTFNGLNVNSNFISNSGRYALKASASYNNNLSQENGGYASIDEFAGETPNLLNAESKSRTQDFAFKHSFLLGEIRVDTTYEAVNDSLHDTLITKSISGNQIISQELRMQRGFFEFQDTIPGPGDYPGNYSSNVTDKQDVISINHTTNWQTNNPNNRAQFELTMLNQYFEVRQGRDALVRDQFINTHLSPGLKLDFGSMELGLKLDYGVTGYTRNDLRVTGNLNFDLNERWTLSGLVDFDSYQPEYFFKNYAQDQFSWNNDLPKTEEMLFKSGLTYQKEEIFSASYSLINDYTFLDATLRPVTFASEISLIQLSLAKHLQAGSFHFKFKGSYQLSNAKDILGIPDYLLFASVYYEHTLFNKHMIGRFGTDVFYTSSYRPYAFMPLMRSFYQQYLFSTGEYPLIDVYFACQVKTALFFVKATNVYNLISGTNYFLTDGYPINPFSLKVGFNWYFMN